MYTYIYTHAIYYVCLHMHACMHCIAWTHSARFIYHSLSAWPNYRPLYHPMSLSSDTLALLGNSRDDLPHRHELAGATATAPSRHQQRA